MPFTRYKKNESSSPEKNKKYKLDPDNSIIATITDSKQLPVVLFPGILGNSSEIQSLAEELYKDSDGKRPIYLYGDPRTENPNDKTCQSLNDHTNETAKELMAIFEDSVLPCIFIGNSYGCIVAAETAKKIKATGGKEVHVFAIDGATAEKTKDYFFTEYTVDESDKLDSVTNDMVEIGNYAARLCSLQQIHPDNSAKDKFNVLLPQSRLEHIEETVLERNNYKPLVNCSNYRTKMGIAKQNLENLGNMDLMRSDTITKLDSVTVLSTHENEKKHGDATLGWQSYSENCSQIKNIYLQKQKHTDLLTSQNTEILAKLIGNNIKRIITIDDVIEKQVKYLTQCLLSRRANQQQEISSDNSDINMAPSTPKIIKNIRHPSNGQSSFTAENIDSNYRNNKAVTLFGDTPAPTFEKKNLRQNSHLGLGYLYKVNA